jgi:VWFA-related protein
MIRRLSLVLLLAGALDAGLPVTGQQRFVARREIVRVDVLVTDHGRPVRDLNAADFDLKDNGVLQDVDFVLSDQEPINTVLTLDMSKSVAGDRLEHLRRASQGLLAALKSDDRAGLITFSHSVELGSALTTDRAALVDALGRVSPGGTTSLVDAAYAGIVMGETDHGRSVVIAFSDGVDTASWLTPEAVLDTSKRAGIVVYGATLKGARAPFLKELTAATGGSVLEVDSTSHLDELFVKVLDEFRQRYLLSFSPKNVTRDGWHRLEVRVKGKTYSIKARPGYLVGNPGNAPAPTGS